LFFSASLTEAKEEHHAMFCKTFPLKIYILFTFISCPNAVKTGNVQKKSKAPSGGATFGFLFVKKWRITMAGKKAQILVVEDDPGILEGLLDLLAFHSYAPEGVAEGREGLRRALAGNFDLVILDVMLPGLDGFSICDELRVKKPHQAILMLTAKGAESDVVTGFRSGADDYVRKPFSLRELLVRVEALLRRSGKAPTPSLLTIGGLVFDGENLLLKNGGTQTSLTCREMDIITYLDRNRARTISQQELLTEVWQYADPDIETRTVDIHIAKLRKKIASVAPEFDPAAKNGKPFLRTVRGKGYQLAVDSNGNEP